MEENFTTSDNNTAPGKASWLKRIGILGFLFFLVKGLVWVGVILWAGRCAIE
ncbi:MAG: hypothetical protein RLY31_1548 [Bacteroidota bacterium]|jgi:hypothetical protein